jgi:hypothetical protein
MARVTGLEPATSGVTGRHSNQLSYTRASNVGQTRVVGVRLRGSPESVKRDRASLCDLPDLSPAKRKIAFTALWKRPDRPATGGSLQSNWLSFLPILMKRSGSTAWPSRLTS